jgi:hypothetical protein
MSALKAGAAAAPNTLLLPIEKKFIRKEKLVNNYLVEEPMPNIKWQYNQRYRKLFGLKMPEKQPGILPGAIIRHGFAPICPSTPAHGN